jgi:hypothetical protein
MATPAANPVEIMTGLGATGVDVILAHVDGAPLQGNPMVPTLQIAGSSNAFLADMDLLLDDRDSADAALLGLLRLTLLHDYEPRAWSRGFTDFQLTRGFLGVSL